MTFEALSVGASGEQVTDVRGRLLFLGFLAPPADGGFDHALEDAVRRYQEQVGHSPTGAVDEDLWQQLIVDTDSHGYSLDQARAGAYDGSWGAHHTTVVEHATPDSLGANDIRGVLRDLSNRVKALAGHHARGIDSACKHFDAYAKGRIKQLDSFIPGSDYGKYLARHLTGEGGKKLTEYLTAGLAYVVPGGKIAEFALTSVWIGFSMTLERKVGTMVKEELSDDETLEQGVTRLMRDIPDQVDAELAAMERQLDVDIEAMFAQLSQHQLFDAETAAWLDPLLTGGPAAMDHFIQHTMGLPIDTAAVRDGVYRALVESFEELVLDKADPAQQFLGAAAGIVEAAGGGGYAALEAEEAARHAEHRRQAHAAAEAAATHLPHAEPRQH